jgi:uracil-DNA glycosylase family 4
MFVGENPSWETSQNAPFANSTISGRALNEHYLEPLGLSRNQVWITDLFKCRYPKHIYRAKAKYNSTIEEVAETCIMRWLIKEIGLADPFIIVTLGHIEVYQRIRRVFDLPTPPRFQK